MKILLDTHVLLLAASWQNDGSAKLPPEIVALIEDPANVILFSAASLWEITVKQALGRDDFKVDARLLRRGLLENGYTELPFLGEHALAVAALPDLHKDPF